MTRTTGATRKKPSQPAPGIAYRTVTSALRPPRARAVVTTPSAFSASACSAGPFSRARSILAMLCSTLVGVVAGPSGLEELDILLLPPEPDRVAFPPSEREVGVGRDLRQE